MFITLHRDTADLYTHIISHICIVVVREHFRHVGAYCKYLIGIYFM